MRTSLNEIREVENFLTNQMSVEDSLVFQAKVITNPLLRMNVNIQRRLMDVLQLSHRRKVKRDIQAARTQLFNSSDKTAFQKTISDIFNH